MDLIYYAIVGTVCACGGALLWSLLAMSAGAELVAQMEEQRVESERSLREAVARAEAAEMALIEERRQTREAEERIADALHGDGEPQ